LDSHQVPVFTKVSDARQILGSTTPNADIGTFTKLLNGDDFETGEMANPDAGYRVMAYEEVWRELDWSKGCEDDDVSWILESVDDESVDDESVDDESVNDVPGITKKFYAKRRHQVRRTASGVPP
jgi:hypothetical protein